MIILKVALCYIIPELIKHVLSSDFFTTWTVFISEAFSIWKHHKLSLAVTQHMFDVLTWWFSELSRRQILPSKVRNHLRHEANLYSSCRKSHEDEKKNTEERSYRLPLFTDVIFPAIHAPDYSEQTLLCLPQRPSNTLWFRCARRDQNGSLTEFLACLPPNSHHSLRLTMENLHGFWLSYRDIISNILCFALLYTEAKSLYVMLGEWISVRLVLDSHASVHNSDSLMKRCNQNRQLLKRKHWILGKKIHI